MLMQSETHSIPHRTRRPVARTKTGCITCKIRRVKCDETKPNCMRCTSTGRQCDGYAQVKITNQSTSAVRNLISAPRHQPSVLGGYGNSIQYLEFYHHCAGPIVSSYFDHDFWSRIALQMAHSEPSVRHAVIALSYLCRTTPGGLKDARHKFVTEDRINQTLIQHYNKSLSCLVSRMTEKSYSVEIGLVTCIIFICMEFLRGNYRTAFAHFNSGLNIILEWKQENSSSPGSSSFSSEETVRPAFSSDIIETKLIPMFIRMITNALLFGEYVPQFYVLTSPEPPSSQKRIFYSLQDAHSDMFELRNVCLLHIRNMGRKFHFQTPITDEDVQHREHLKDCLQAWLSALNVFEHNSRSTISFYKNLSHSDTIAIHSLRVNYYAIYIWTCGCTDDSQMIYDDYVADFKLLNHHAKIAIDNMQGNSDPTSPTLPTPSSPAANYTFELNVIPPLYFCATRCRDPTTRRTALALLARRPPREGLWDARQCQVVGQRCMEIEEGGLDPMTGTPIESMRLCSIIVNADMDQEGNFKVPFLARRLLFQKECGPEKRTDLERERRWEETLSI